MDSLTTPAVLTSKMARSDYQDIVGQHTDLLKGMAGQNIRRMASTTKMINEQSVKMSDLRENMSTSTQMVKNANDFNLKNEELSIKRAALNQ